MSKRTCYAMDGRKVADLRGRSGYELREPLTLDDLMDPSDVQPTPAPPPVSDDRSRFPKGAEPGGVIRWSGPSGTHEGLVLDRAPQGYDYYDERLEASGYWLWILVDDPSVDTYGLGAVRVRYWSRGKRKGQAQRDDGRYGGLVVRTILGAPMRFDNVQQLADEYRRAMT